MSSIGATKDTLWALAERGDVGGLAELCARAASETDRRDLANEARAAIAQAAEHATTSTSAREGARAASVAMAMLAGLTTYGVDEWSGALVSLAANGTLPRERLLDASLGALEREPAASRVAWASRLHEALGPTPEERHTRTDGYLRLLASSNPAVASFALDAVAALDASAPCAAAELAQHLRPFLGGKHKGTAKTALKLLAAAAEREPALRPRLVLAAVAALGHEVADVQKAAFDLLERYRSDVANDAELCAAVARKGPLVASSLRSRLAAFAAPTTASGTRAAPPRAAQKVKPARRPSRVSPLDPSRALRPIETLDELVDRFARVLEDDSDPSEVDLVLDGVSRLSPERPPDFEARTASLRKRAARFRQRQALERPLAYVMGGVASAWLAGEALEKTDPARAVGFLDVFIGLAREVAEGAIARMSRPLLCAPTHRGGVVDPAALAKRLKGLSLPPGTHDAAIALLRLPPRGGAKPPTKPFGDLEVGAALAYALGANVRIGNTAALWIAAARARDPRGDDAAIEARHPNLGPDAGTAARFTWNVTARKQGTQTVHDLVVTTTPPLKRIPLTTFPSVMLHAAQDSGAVAGFEKNLVRWSATVWPGGIESFVASGLPAFVADLDWSKAESQNAAFLEPLREPTTALGPLAVLLLGAALGATEPGEHALAVEATIAALREGRLDGATLGEALAEHRSTGLAKLGRVAQALRTVAAASEEHSAEVRVAIARSLRGDPKDAPSDEGALVDLLRELCVAANEPLADADAARYIAERHHAKQTAAVRARG